MRTRLIGIGNPILRDDAVGLYVARKIRLLAQRNGLDVDVVESEVGGFALMELMIGWDKIILVDAVKFDSVEPGTVVSIDPRDLKTSHRLRSVHDIDLPTILDLGRYLGLSMPSKVYVFGIQVKDDRSFGESLTDEVQNGMENAIQLILRECKICSQVLKDA